MPTVQPAAPTAAFPLDQPDITISVRQTFGIDSDLQVPAFSQASEHVRAYNSAWNYYAGMSDGEIEAEIRHDTVWQRPSWRLGDRYGPGYGARIRDYFDMFSAGGGRSRDRGRRNDNRGQEAAQRALSAREQALAVFEIAPPFTPVRLKARYIALVKLHHPDAHGGDKVAEEKLKIVNQAYATLKASYFS